MSNIRFTETRLSASGLKGVLKPDADGYYEIIVGGLNMLNSAGEYYTLNGARELFEESGILMRRIRSGNLFGENGHPARLPGQSIDDYINRILRIDERNVCCHFKEIWLDLQYGRAHPEFKNPELVAIMAKVKPAGPYASVLQEALDNPSQNVCFSIRALTEDFRERGQTYRVLKTICCWDRVTEPGLHIANKFNAPGLESIQDLPVTRTQISRIIETAQTDGVSTEDTRLIVSDLTRAITPTDALVKPIYHGWR